MVQEHDPEPERYYDWMLWKLRQEKKMEQDDPMDDITKGGSLSGWTEKPYISPQQMWEREIAEMQKPENDISTDSSYGVGYRQRYRT